MSVTRKSLSDEAGRLLDVLMARTDEDRTIQAPTASLLADTGLTQLGLIRARTELTQKGLIRVQPGFSSSGLRGANIYTIDPAVDWVAFWGFLEDESGPTGTDDSPAPAQQASGDLPPSSGRREAGRRSRWSLFRRRGTSS